MIAVIPKTAHDHLACAVGESTTSTIEAMTTKGVTPRWIQPRRWGLTVSATLSTTSETWEASDDPGTGAVEGLMERISFRLRANLRLRRLRHRRYGVDRPRSCPRTTRDDDRRERVA